MQKIKENKKTFSQKMQKRKEKTFSQKMYKKKRKEKNTGS